MRHKAEEALKDILEEYFPNASSDRREEIVNAFRDRIRL